MAPKILIVKTTSMGDVIHALPAIHDIRRAMPKAQIDWLVEGSFSDIPSLSADVNRVFKVAVRRWRKSLFAKETRQEIAPIKNNYIIQNFIKKDTARCPFSFVSQKSLKVQFLVQKSINSDGSPTMFLE